MTVLPELAHSHFLGCSTTIFRVHCHQAWRLAVFQLASQHTPTYILCSHIAMMENDTTPDDFKVAHQCPAIQRICECDHHTRPLHLLRLRVYSQRTSSSRSTSCCLFFGVPSYPYLSTSSSYRCWLSKQSLQPTMQKLFYCSLSDMSHKCNSLQFKTTQ